MMQAKHRSRRLRKKLRIGEFQEFGFGVSFQLRPELPKEELENFWDAFILEAIERNGLVYGGGTRMGSFPCRAVAPLRTHTGTFGAHRSVAKNHFCPAPLSVQAQARAFVFALALRRSRRYNRGHRRLSQRCRNLAKQNNYDR